MKKIAPEPVSGFKGTVLLPEQGEVKRIFWLMHGSGGHASEIVNAMAPTLQKMFPDAAIYAPEGPVPARNGNSQHFEIEKFYNKQLFIKQPHELTLTEKFNRAAIARNVEISAEAINETLDIILKHHGLSEADTVMIGYSQGGSCVLQAALTRPQPVEQVISIFGSWLGEDNFGPSVLSRPPVLMISSKTDQVVPSESIVSASKAFNKTGIPTRLILLENEDHHKDWARVALKILPSLKK